jgi:hypothetical protein
MNIETQALIVNLLVLITGLAVLFWIYRKAKKKTSGGCGGNCGCAKKKPIIFHKSPPKPKG